MKATHNDSSNKSVKVIKKIKLNKKYDFSTKNNSDISSPKLHCIKNLKKNINIKINPIKHDKSNFKKSFDSKILLKPNIKNKSISKNYKTITPQTIRNNPKSNGINKKSRVIIKNKNNSKNKIDNKNPNIHESKNNNKNKSFNNISNKAKDSKESKYIKCHSTSTGVSVSSNENKKYVSFQDSENNNHNHNYNVDSQSIEKNNILIEENKENINNFCYESGTKEQDQEQSNDNKIIIKCDNYSLLTFGNSFSYSNSQKSKSTKKFFNIDSKNNDTNIINEYNNKSSCFNLFNQCYMNNNYVNKLKEENENLKKELKESNDQITFLINQIKELKGNKYNKNKKFFKNKISPPNLWDKRKMHLDFDDKENCNSNNNNEKKIVKQDSKINAAKNKNSSIRAQNENNNIINKSKLKIGKIKISKRLSLKNKKIQNNLTNMECNEKPFDKLNQCISMIKI